MKIMLLMIRLVALCVCGRCFSYLCLVAQGKGYWLSFFRKWRNSCGYSLYFQFVFTPLYVFLNKVYYRMFGYDLLCGKARQQLNWRG